MRVEPILTIYSSCRELWELGLKNAGWLNAQETSFMEREVMPRIGRIPLAEASTRDFDNLQYELAKEDPKAWKAVMARRLSFMLFQYGLEKRLVKHNPVEDSVRMKTKIRMCDGYTDRQWLRIYDHIRNMQDGTFYLLQLISGFSVREIQRLRISEYHRKERKLLIGSEKYGERFIRIPNNIADCLETAMAETKQKKKMAGKDWNTAEDYLFTDETGNPYSHNRILRDIRWIKKAVEQYSPQRCTAHVQIMLMKKGATILDLCHYYGINDQHRMSRRMRSLGMDMRRMGEDPYGMFGEIE